MVVAGYSGGGGGELDERLVAKAALDAAEEQLESLCASHAGAFVAVERRSAALSQALEELMQEIKTVEHETQNAQSSLNVEALQQVSERHRVRRRTLLQHSSLLELLELPSLMDACMRSNLYEQALAIAAFGNTLERRHGNKEDSAVVQKVISQIRSRQIDLKRHLLHRLKSSITMPVCLEIVTALRRLNSIDLERQQQQQHTKNLEKIHAAMETRLQVDFLEARDAWLESSSSSTPSEKRAQAAASSTTTSSSEHLLDTIERYRTRCFEIATQFLAIFRNTPTSASLKGVQDDSSPSSLLSMWTTRRVHSFLTMLSIEINAMSDMAALRDTLEACVFFATSMGRLGADFTPLLPPLLEPKALSLVVTYWTDGVVTLEETLKACRNAGVAFPLVSNTATTTNSDDTSMPYVDDSKTPPAPPRQLLQLPPLARFLNSYLTGLNELRRCLFAGNFTSLRQSLQQVLENVHKILQTHERAVLAPGLRGEAKQLREVAARYMDVFSNVMEPYMRAALEVALGDYEAAKVILPKREVVVEEEVEDKQDDEDNVEEDEQKDETVVEQEDAKKEDVEIADGAPDQEQQQPDTPEHSFPSPARETIQEVSGAQDTTVPGGVDGKVVAQTTEAVPDKYGEGGWKEEDFGDM